MKRRSSIGFTAIIMGAFLYAGCSSGSLDNPRQGTITIAADESFQPVVSALTKAYEGIYPDAHFNVLYRPEQEAVLALLQDSARLAIVTRELTDKQKDMITKQEGAHRGQETQPEFPI